MDSLTKIARMFLNGEIYGQHYIAMEDLRKDMEFPCILDIKMGSQAYNPLKIARQTSKIASSSSASHGFRLCGFGKFVKEDGIYNKVSVDKYRHRQIGGDRISEEAALFFTTDAGLRRKVVESVLQ